MIFKRTILSKMLSNGLKADVALVKEDDIFQAALYVGGRHIPGPALPQALDPPKGDITHWMGNRPSVGLSQVEAEKILREVTLENSVIQHRKLGY
ncbi:MAG: hypothetical protein M0T70_12900 [Geobacteraceae bacterium]|nr:hypothetical protein [Geobacteraceae bacterium]